jgi:hypothetical protein
MGRDRAMISLLEGNSCLSGQFSMLGSIAHSDTTLPPDDITISDILRHSMQIAVILVRYSTFLHIGL